MVWFLALGINFRGATFLSSIDIQTSKNMNEQFSRVYKIQTIDAISRLLVHVTTMLGVLGQIIVYGELPPDMLAYSLHIQLVPKTRA